MEQVKDKKKKLTLKNFSGGAAAISSYAKGSGNKPVLIEKKKIILWFILKIISERTSRLLHGRDALLILTLLLQYHKYETQNPYVVKLSILDDELALTVSISSSCFIK